MGTFADTPNVDYRLLFADQGKNTSLFGFQKTNGSLLFPFSACSKQMENETTGNFHLFAANGKQKRQTSVCFLYIYKYICCHFKRKTEAQAISLIRLPFAHRVNESLSFICLFTKKQTEVIRLQMDSTNLPIYAGPRTAGLEGVLETLYLLTFKFKEFLF
jgi:hypothetical protein